MPSYEERLGQMEAVLKNSVGSVFYGEQRSGPRFVFLNKVIEKY